MANTTDGGDNKLKAITVKELLARVQRARFNAVALEEAATWLENSFGTTNGAPPAMLVKTVGQAAFAARSDDVRDLATRLRNNANRERMSYFRLQDYLVQVDAGDATDQSRPYVPARRDLGEGMVPNPARLRESRGDDESLAVDAQTRKPALMVCEVVKAGA